MAFSLPKRQPKPVRKFLVENNDYLRLWYSSTNSYSTCLYINGPSFSKYQEGEKAYFSKGTVVMVKDQGETVKGIVLARGTFEKMEALDDVLHTLAEDSQSTSVVLDAVDKRLKALNRDADVDDSDDDIEYIPPPKKCLKNITSEINSTFEPDVQSSLSNMVMYESKILKEHNKINSLSASSLGKKYNDSLNVSKDKTLILAELHLQSMLLRKVVSQNDDILECMQYLKPEEIDIPREDDIYIGHDGSNFSLSDLCNSSPSVFARVFLRKKYSNVTLATKILCPKGTTNRVKFTDAQNDEIKSALSKWYGRSFNWKIVVASVNQFLCEIKLNQ